MECLRWGGPMWGDLSKRRLRTVGICLAAVVTSAALGTVTSAEAQNQRYAGKQRSVAAIGHYARARALLVEALAEFEQGRQNARPDMLVDPEEWRLSLISRTEELNRLIDPKPRVTRAGVQFRANKALIRRERDRLPAVADGAQDRNTYGEEMRRRELQNTRASLESAPSGEATREMANIRSLVQDALSEDQGPQEAAPPAGAAVPPTQPDQGLIFGGDEEAQVEDQDVEVPPSAAGAKALPPAARAGTGAETGIVQPTPGEAQTEVEEEEVGQTNPVGTGGQARFVPGVDPARDGLDTAEGTDPKSAAVEDAIQKKLTQRDTPSTVGTEEVLEEEVDPEQ